MMYGSRGLVIIRIGFGPIIKEPQGIMSTGLLLPEVAHRSLTCPSPPILSTCFKPSLRALNSQQVQALGYDIAQWCSKVLEHRGYQRRSALLRESAKTTNNNDTSSHHLARHLFYSTVLPLALSQNGTSAQASDCEREASNRMEELERLFP